jgi:hypothetical protein
MQRWKFSLVLGFLLVVAAAVGSSGKTAHAATTRVWTGAVGYDWNTAANWNPAGVPVNGDSVVVGTTASLITGVPAGMTLNSLTLGGTVEFYGGPLKITSAITVTKQSLFLTIDLVVILDGDVQISIPEGSTLGMRRRLSPLGTVAVNAAGHTLLKSGGGDLEFNADLVGLGTVAATGGIVSFLYPVTFGGTISLGPGTRALLTVLGDGTGFCGSAPNTTFVLSGARLSAACVVSIRSVSGAGTIDVFDEDSRLFVAGSGGTAIFDGGISGSSPSGIICCSGGGQTFRGVSTFTGNVLVNGGELFLDGATFPSASQFTLQGRPGFRPTLGGYGAFGQSILTDGNLAFDSVGGKFGLARFPSLQLAPSVTVTYEIKSATPGTGFTQVVMAGEVFLDSALLSIDFNAYEPAGGQAITLIKGATGLFGTFHNAANGQNLPEGAVFTASGMQFKITYKGGAGHDVVITRQGGAATPTPSPSPTSTPSPQMKYKDFIPMVARES